MPGSTSSELLSSVPPQVRRVVANFADHIREVQEYGAGLVGEFLGDPSLGEWAIPAATVVAKVRELTTVVAKLEQLLRNIDVNAYYGEEKLWSRLEGLAQLIRVKLTELDRRLH